MGGLGFFSWALISFSFVCFDPPTDDIRKTADEFEKFKDESVNVKTQTELGTFSMAISGVSLGNQAGGKIEFGIAHIADLGGIVPQRIEITPFVYNQMGVSEEMQVELNRDQGAGLKIQMGNQDREWAFFVKGFVSADPLIDSSDSSDSSLPATVSFGLSRSFGAEDSERLKNLQRLRRLKKPIVVTVTDEEFDGSKKFSREAVELIHRAIMTTYLPEAIDHWYQQNKNNKDVKEELEFHLSNPPRLYEFLRRQLLEGRPLYVEAKDQRQKIIRPTRYESGMVVNDSILFDHNQMVLDFVTTVDFKILNPQDLVPSSRPNSHQEGPGLPSKSAHVHATGVLGGSKP